MFEINQRVAWVTGASRGIGEAIAHQLGSLGAKVVGTATTAQGADRITEAFKKANIDGVGCVLNIANRETLPEQFKALTEHYGPAAILVNNAGITRDNLFVRLKSADWDDVLMTNLTGVFELTKLCMKPMMKARYGRIVNISSVVGVMGNAGQTNYAASKAGLIGFSKSLAKEVASRGITINVVAPGFIKSDMTQGENGLSEEQSKALLSTIPLGRMGGAEEIASAVAFLASDTAAYITGETLNVNGGMLMD